METVGAPAPVFCLRAQGRRKAAKGPSFEDRCRARSGEARNIARTCNAEGIGMHRHVELVQLSNFRQPTPALLGPGIPISRPPNPIWPLAKSPKSPATKAAPRRRVRIPVRAAAESRWPHWCRANSVGSRLVPALEGIAILRHSPSLVGAKKVGGNVGLQRTRKVEELLEAFGLARQDHIAGHFISADVHLAAFEAVAHRQAQGLAFAIAEKAWLSVPRRKLLGIDPSLSLLADW